MKHSIVMATAALAAVAHSQVLLESFKPGLEVTPTCIAKPNLNHCPAKLPSGNALLTSWSYVVRSDGEQQSGDDTLFRVQFQTKDDEVVEDRTLSLFDMPPGYEDKQCRLKFIYNFGNAYPRGEYSVWALEGDGSDVTTHTTWGNKPEATEKLATFVTGDKRKGDLNPGENNVYAKMDGTFVSENPTFPCPGPGEFAFETRGDDPEKLNLSNALPLNCAGGDGLAIEILDVPSGYEEGEGDNEDGSVTATTTTTASQVPGVPHSTSVILPPSGTVILPPMATTTLVPISNPDDDDEEGFPPTFESGASHATAFFGGAVLMAAALPFLF